MRQMHGRGRLAVLAAGLTLAAGAGTATVVMQSSATAAVHPNTVTSAGAKASKSGKAGWQGTYTYSVPTGTTSLFFHYPCPSKRIAVNGGFGVNGASPTLVGSAARADITPIYGEWGWTFTFPSGSPSGTTIGFNVYCQ